jgi:hypothetical protein
MLAPDFALLLVPVLSVFLIGTEDNPKGHRRHTHKTSDRDLPDYVSSLFKNPGLLSPRRILLL